MPRTSRSTEPAILVKRRGFSYLAVFHASPLERIDMIKQGVRAVEAKRILAALAIGQGRDGQASVKSHSEMVRFKAL